MSDVDWNNIKADDDTVITNKGEEINIEIKKAFEPKSLEDCKSRAYVVPPQRVGTPEGKDEVVIPLDRLHDSIKNFIPDLHFKFPKYNKCLTLMNSVKYELIDTSMPELEFATEGSVGMDLYTKDDEYIPPFAAAYKVNLNVKLDIPSEVWLMLACRSSFPIKYPGLIVSNGFGVIDSDYRGAVCLLVTNLTSEIKFIPKGAKIAQLVAMPSVGVKYQKIEKVDDDGSHLGFGSTDKK